MVSGHAKYGSKLGENLLTHPPIDRSHIFRSSFKSRVYEDTFHESLSLIHREIIKTHYIVQTQ